MWLKQMVIDGFKSYCNRTVIKDWDRHFTAITGLNGSGKSNILDAICFVLGITNLQQVRVTNLQQLVYKEGQARVTRASVSLVLDNTDKSQSPMGYEMYDEITVTRQVVIGGRNKYLINGQSAQLGRVKDLFLSVQLDVNNPHFLIMQGRITKVLNMKPMEILGMIQEAAGTKMYELKKAQSIKIMDKKQVKVNEINRILEEEITPQLDKLRREKTHYEKWTQNNSEIQRLERLMTAYKYMSNKDKINKFEQELKDSNEEIEETKSEMAQFKDKIENIKNEIEVKQSQRNKQEESDYKQLTEKLNKINLDLSSIDQKIKHKNETIKREQDELKSLENTLKNNKKLLKRKEEEAKQIELSFADTNQRSEYLEDRIRTLESSLLGINNDNDENSNDNGNDGSLASQLMKAKKEFSKLKSQLRSNTNRIKTLEKEIKNEEKRAAKLNRNFAKMEKEKQTKEAQLELLQQQLQEVGFDEKKQEDLENAINTKRDERNTLDGELRGLQNALRKFEFDYHNPFRGFDRSMVYGKLGTLFDISDNKYAKAIEVTAGGRLYNVVVTTNDVAKALLDKGNLQYRVTILPLNKMQGRVVDNATVRRAKNLVGEENCHLALELIGYKEELDSAMKYTFGSTFVCSDLATAKEVAFNRDIKKKTVTYDGEVYNPGGLLTGGSSGNESNILLAMSEYNEKKTLYERINNEMGHLNNQLNQVKNMNRQTLQLREKIEDFEQEIKDLNDTMADSAYQDTLTQIENKKAEINNLTNNKKVEIENQLEQIQRKITDLSNDMENFKDRSKKEQEFKKEILKCKKELKKLGASISEMNENTNRIQLEINDCKTEINETENKVNEQKELVNNLSNVELTELKDSKKSTNQIKYQITKDLAKAKKQLAQQDTEIRTLFNQKARYEKRVKESELALLEQQNGIKDLKGHIKRAEASTNKLLDAHSWLKDENENDLRKLYRSYGKLHSRKASMVSSARKSAKKKQRGRSRSRRNKNGKKILPNGLTDSEEESETETEDENGNENDDISMDNNENNNNNNNNNANGLVGGMTQAVGVDLDATANDNIIYNELHTRLNKLKIEQAQLNKQINHKVMSMFERAETEYRDLIKKREIVKNDKKKIESVIAELDRKKEDTLSVTFEKVNEHFENIFSKLLPGTHCKLSTVVDGNGNELSLLDGGLEVRVAFGDVWKESLSELSGGQRSLLALSLILSLLLFKPAPLYILDEIDAALDLSHTQNIGILLSKYFNKSQFIVVSLKEGMFNNANVIFRTSFVDGVSHVKRTVGHGIRSSKNRHRKNDNNNNSNKENDNSNVASNRRGARSQGRRR